MNKDELKNKTKDEKKDGKKDGKKSDDKAASTAAPRVHKTALGQFEDNVAKAQKFISRARRSFQVWLATAAEVGDKKNLGEGLTFVTEIEPRLNDLKVCLTTLVASGFSPAVAPRGPKFTPGEVVKVEDEWMEKYTKSGFYKAEELLTLTIVAVGEKEVLTKTASGRELTIRSAAHLEATTAGGVAA